MDTECEEKTLLGFPIGEKRSYCPWVGALGRLLCPYDVQHTLKMLLRPLRAPFAPPPRSLRTPSALPNPPESATPSPKPLNPKS
eukprot:1184563-Prorocentrum_minimum.AAC.2